MTDTKPTLEASTKDICEWVLHYYGYQPANMSQTEKWLYKLAGEFAAIKSQPVPVEPEQIKMMRYDEPEGRSDYERAITDYIDSLQSALQVAQQKRDAEKEIVLKAVKQICTPMSENIKGWKERAEKAEASNKRLVELLREPSEAMIDAGLQHLIMRGAEGTVDELKEDAVGVFKAMSAELLREAGK